MELKKMDTMDRGQIINLMVALFLLFFSIKRWFFLSTERSRNVEGPIKEKGRGSCGYYGAPDSRSFGLSGHSYSAPKYSAQD
jgi:hypothetical protein